MKQQIGEEGENFALTESKLALVNRCIELAEKHFLGADEKARFGQVTWWDDGDFRVEISHGFGNRDDHRHEREMIKTKASAGRIVYVRYIHDMLGHEDQTIEEFVVDKFEVEDNSEKEDD